ncbi:MAG: hypothetical protein ACPG5B_06105 [Chitinophagales bacterium]
MSKELNLEKKLTDVEHEAVLSSLNQVSDVLSKFAVHLTDEDRKGIRTVAAGREGYVRDTYRVAKQFENYIPRNINIDELGELLRLFDLWREMQVLCEKISEQVDDTAIAIGHELMQRIDIIYNVLQLSGRLNANLDRALSRLQDYNKRFANKTESSENEESTESTSEE